MTTNIIAFILRYDHLKNKNIHISNKPILCITDTKKKNDILKDHSDYYLSERKIVVLNPIEPFFNYFKTRTGYFKILTKHNTYKFLFNILYHKIIK